MRRKFQTNSKLTLAGDIVFKKMKTVLIIILVSIQMGVASLKVEKILFEGNISFKSKDLKALLKTQEKEDFDNKLIRIDRKLVTNFYLGNGFLNVWVEAEFDRRGEKINVIFKISEDKRFLLGGIKFSGGEIFSSARLRDFVPQKDGDYFQINKIEEGLNKIEEYYYNNGKPYIEIKEDQTVQDSLIFIEINIKENETVIINKVDYLGLQQVKSFIISRELEIGKNDIYSRQKIEKSQRNIYGTGLFDYVGMQLKAIDSTRSKVNLMIKVVEKKSKWIGARFGIGYEQEIVYGGTFDFTLEFGHRNLFGTARSLFLTVTPSFSYDFDRRKVINPKNQYSLTYVEPWIGYTRTPGIFRFSFVQVRPVYSANYDFYTSSFLIKHEFENDWEVSGTAAYNQVEILEGDSLDPDFFLLTKGQDFIYSLSSGLTRDSRDNFLNPRNGSLLDFNIRFAYSKSRDSETGQTSSNRFIRLIGEWSRYQPYRLQRKWVLASRIKAGDIFELGERSTIPVSERFFLGGASTVRGYREQLLGPVVYDENGQNPKAVGGKLIFLANIELRIPLFWLLWGEIFVDGGNVWLQPDDFRLGDIKTTMGIGAAFLTPLGPIRFDYGLKHKPEKTESNGEFHISIAFAF